MTHNIYLCETKVELPLYNKNIRPLNLTYITPLVLYFDVVPNKTWMSVCKQLLVTSIKADYCSKRRNIMC